MATESDLNRYRNEAVKLRGEIAKASSAVAASRKKANDARTAAGRTKNESTIRSKMRDIDRAERDAAAGEKKHGELEKKLAAAEGKVAKAQTDVDKKRAADQKKVQADQKKALDNLRRQNDTAAAQFRPAPRRLYEPTLADRRPTPSADERSLAEPSPNSDMIDVFLSHASEDKDAIARPLKEALEARGLTVWFDEIKIKVGQSIRQEIEKGIANARFGVVIISPDFFKKQWTNAELDALFSRKMDSGENMILPIWHKVTKAEVAEHGSLLVGTLALNSSLMTVEEMADAIAEVVRS